uniref:Glycosyltransferase RgtA/B/C/D-like domain-containing protein n=1 Tax=Prevotella sp. GTC17254 TaxID=3236794 RepID=A0AB33J5L4_9BACT
MAIFAVKISIKDMSENRGVLFWTLLFVAIVTTLPFLGLTEFYSKGEPREAVVALSMLKDGNWILPINNGGDIPYKPPFFHWIIALLSLPQGYVSEFTSRLPSALSLIIMVIGGYLFNARRQNASIAFMTAMLTLSAFEVHRAGMACRVDMLLTLCMVGSYWLLYRWWERGMRGFPLWAVLSMSGAALTKGPVGILLPCFVIGVFMLIRGIRWWKVFSRLTLLAIAACIIPALWYIAAYHQAGNHFLSLVMEENFGRFTGTMSYASHEHPFTYNFMTLFVGWTPWTLLAVFSLFSIKWQRPHCFVNPLRRLRTCDSFQLFTWLAFGLTLFFYCIPSSKRSVYLLPCYPFMALLLAQYIVGLIQQHRRTVNTFVATMSVLGVLLIIAFIIIRAGVIPDTIFHGKHAEDNILTLHAMENAPLCFGNILLLALPVLIGIPAFYTAVRHSQPYSTRHLMVAHMFSIVFVIFMLLDGFILPTVLNVKSERPLAEFINHRYAKESVYQYLETPMLHFFGTDFYAGDRIRQFELDRPAKGVVMLKASEKEAFIHRHQDYQFVSDWHSARRLAEVKDTIYFYRFKRSSTK